MKPPVTKITGSDRNITAVVDLMVLSELRQLDECGELLETLITHFIQDTPNQLPALGAEFAAVQPILLKAKERAPLHGGLRL